MRKLNTSKLVSPLLSTSGETMGLPHAAPLRKLPHCPAGPQGKQLPDGSCPLKVPHPPEGEEFALGCGVCRNAQTF